MPGPRSPDWTREMGQRVAQLRKEHGWTQGELAEKVGRDEQYLSKVERGERRPGPKTRSSLAVILDTNVMFLLTGDATSREVERAAYPELALLKAGQEWRDAHPKVREYIEGLAQSGGDQPLSEWIADFKKAAKDHRLGRSLEVTRDALGREAEEDVVADPDDGR